MNLSRVDLVDLRSPIAIAEKIHRGLENQQPPFDVQAIAKALDIEAIEVGRYDGFEGMLLTDVQRSRGSIMANISKGDRRARFTIAHELGHFLMEWHELSSTDGFQCQASDMTSRKALQKHQKQENQANTFAIEVLAPRNGFDRELSEVPDLADMTRLAKTFELSLEACARRLVDRREEPIAIVWSRNGVVRYSYKGSEFPWIKLTKGDKISTDSQAGRIIKGEKQGRSKMCEANAAHWLQNSDIYVQEQTRLGKNGFATTLLWADIPDEEDDGGLAELTTPGFR